MSELKKCKNCGRECEKERAEKEQDMISKMRMAQIKAEIKQAKQESRARLEDIKRQIRVNSSFFN